MTEEAIVNGTGRTKSDWFEILISSEKSAATHKEIADYLHETHNVSYWWAQTLTVEYEYHIGRRILGQTQDGRFQLGVSKTIRAEPAVVWEMLNSSSGIATLFGEVSADPDHLEASGLAALNGVIGDAVWLKTTTFVPGSHVRLQWREPGWVEHSILQIRLTPKGDKTALSFHHEKLPSLACRDELRVRWKGVATAIASAIATAANQRSPSADV